MHEAQTSPFPKECLVQTLQKYNGGDLSGNNTCPTQIDIEDDAGASMRGAYEVRLRKITVQGHQI